MNLCRAGLALVLVSLMVLLAGPGVAVGDISGTSGQVSMVTSFNIPPSYDVYGTGVSQVNATVSGTGMQLSGNQSAELISSFRPTTVDAIVVVGNVTRPLHVTVTPGRFGTFYSYDFTLPGNTTSFRLLILGSIGGNSFLWRYIANAPTLELYEWTGPFPASITKVELPSGNEVYQIYDGNGNPLPSSYLTEVSSGNGTVTYQIYYSGKATIIVESQWFAPVTVLVAIAAVFAIALVALGFFRDGKRMLGKLTAGVRRVVPQKILPRFKLRSLFRPRTLLVLFLLCAFFMVALGAAGGPDPRVKAYVISDPSSVASIQSSLSVVGNVAVVTPAQDYTDFGTMSSVGMFNMVVVSNYPPLELPVVSEYVLPSLGSVPIIVVDDSADPTFSVLIDSTYGNNIVHVQNASSLTQAESQEIASRLSPSSRSNLLGLDLGVTQFKLVLAIEAVLSFVLIFLGWAYLGSLVSDSGSQSSWVFLGTVVASGVFVFVFSELIYIEVSSLLAFPLSLHAVISGAGNVTAVGLLGFGGGSTPRLAAGFVGVLVGAFGVVERPRLHKEDFALLIAIPLVLLVNPFFVGSFVYEGVLLFVGNFAFGTAYTTSLSFKGFIYGVGSALGGGVSPTYLLSAGKMLFFAGLPVLAYLRRMSRTTMALGLLVCAFMIGDGGVRVGEMTPMKTYAAVVPGLLVGFAIVGLLLALAALEKYMRGMKQ